ncbi:LRR receptor-like serine/threonine-protein kinase EFR [Macadamia integrifolia]|uniref:LRR receptor-like serine/threonine-protein kinase EFR n=1 Tax=Macadamia integrifolia TaxID=60698 RepID=UPI001C4ECA57|nr:LRR receptor-like serine/threonine-protein kinase EFR [Macadamia integrifolia]
MAVQLLVFILLFGFSLRLESITGRRIVGNERDQLALLELKKQIDDPYQALHSWNDSNYFCDWVGVSCGSHHQRVINLNLTGKGLGGYISPSLVVSVVQNQLHGSHPRDISFTLPNLHEIYIGINLFLGGIPNSISNISTLEAIDLGYNNFVGPVPNNLGNLQNFQLFVIGGNQCGTGEANDFDFVYPLFNCTHLETLDIRSNGFKGPLSFFKANLSTQLSILVLGGNQISGTIPVGFEYLVKLTALSMEQNFLEGNIPSGIGKLLKLQRLFLGGNRLSGQIPSFIGNLTLLYELHLEANNFNASIPSSL